MHDMSKINDMNEWGEYRERLRKDIDSQVTSNKALLWVGIALNGIAALIALIIAVIALINTLMIGRDIASLQKDLIECRTLIDHVTDNVEHAKRTCDNARHRESRSRKRQEDTASEGD